MLAAPRRPREYSVMPIILRPDTLADLPPAVARPTYDRGAARAGIVHLSVGNFHRAHQAVYADRLLEAHGVSDWGIAGVGLIDDARERAKRDALTAQGGLYTLTECPPDAPATCRVVGSLLEYHHAPDDPEAALRRMSDPAIRIVTMTVTEGGYNTGADGVFDLAHPGIAADLAPGAVPRTAFGLVAEALRRRRDAGTGPFTVLSCDNLRHNGHVAGNAVLTFARAKDPALADWIEANVTFPACMVDRITPATLPADVARLDAASGVDDSCPVFAEDFMQWVVEDRFCAGRPPLERVGVQFTDDVAPYEQVKIRMLNGSHLVLGYAGTLLGFAKVHEAMADPLVARLIARFLDEDAAPLIEAPPGMETGPYAALLARRYGNPAINDQIARIAGDGGSKLPVYLQDTVRGVLDAGRDHSRLAFTLAAFAEYLGGPDLFEPGLDARARALATDGPPRAALDLPCFAGWGLAAHEGFAADFERMRASIRARGARATLEDILA